MPKKLLYQFVWHVFVSHIVSSILVCLLMFVLKIFLQNFFLNLGHDNWNFMKADEAVKEINLWVEFQTNGLIRNVLQRHHVTPLTALILGNALYFKGAWENKFNPKWTQKRDFFLLNGDKVSVPFMTSS